MICTEFEVLFCPSATIVAPVSYTHLLNLEKRNDQIGSVCKVTSEEEEITDENSNADFENITEGEGEMCIRDRFPLFWLP